MGVTSDFAPFLNHERIIPPLPNVMTNQYKVISSAPSKLEGTFKTKFSMITDKDYQIGKTFVMLTNRVMEVGFIDNFHEENIEKAQLTDPISGEVITYWRHK